MSPKSAAVAARGQLNRETLIDRAVQLAAAEGLESVTVRRLAQDLGVTPMALYWHFKNKDELLAAMGERVLAAVVVPSDDGEDWDVRLHAIVASLVAALRAHPALVQLAATRTFMCQAGMDLTEQTLALLRSAGFSATDAATVAHNAMMTAMMLVTGEPGAEGHHGDQDREEKIAAKTAALVSLPADRYPNVVASFGSFLDCADEQDYYATGVDLFIHGVRGWREERVMSAQGTIAQ